jgi:hypothetical protein
VCGGSLHSEEHGCQVGSDDLFERSERCLADGCGARNPGVGEYDIELAKLLYDLCDSAFGRLDIGHVRPNGQYAAPELGGCRVQALLIPPGNGHARTLGQKEPRGGQADAAVSARDQCRLVRESHLALPLSGLAL